MTHTELDKVASLVGGMGSLIDMLRQIALAKPEPPVSSLARRLNGTESLYEFFADGPGFPPAGYYIHLDEDEDTYPALAAYDTINLVYGYCGEVQAGEGYTFPFLKKETSGYSLIKMETYQWHIH